MNLLLNFARAAAIHPMHGHSSNAFICSLVILSKPNILFLLIASFKYPAFMHPNANLKQINYKEQNTGTRELNI